MPEYKFPDSDWDAEKSIWVITRKPKGFANTFLMHLDCLGVHGKGTYVSGRSLKLTCRGHYPGSLGYWRHRTGQLIGAQLEHTQHQFSRGHIALDTVHDPSSLLRVLPSTRRVPFMPNRRVSLARFWKQESAERHQSCLVGQPTLVVTRHSSSGI
jgi:hypothetical protein